MSKTKIDWCDETWNPVYGCLNECHYCYARRIAQKHGRTEAERKFIPHWREDSFNKKFARSTHRVFVNSMSDIMFWEPKWMERVLERIADLPEIEFIFLTKGGYAPYHLFEYPPNVIAGVTVTTRAQYEELVNDSRDTRAPSPPTAWALNIEPMLEPVLGKDEQFAEAWDWIIMGPETGDSSKTSGIAPVLMKMEWVMPIVISSLRTHTSVFMKEGMVEMLNECGAPRLRQYPDIFKSQ